MSERERWVVYPLLFLALGVALRDKMLKRVDTDSMIAGRGVASPVLNANRVICRELIVQSRDGQRTMAKIAEHKYTRSGRLETYDRLGLTTDVVGEIASGFLPSWIFGRRNPKPGTTPPSHKPVITPPDNVSPAPGSVPKETPEKPGD